MCTLVILRRSGHDWPLIIAANRDEMLGRPWLPPGRHWPDRPEVRAGLDQQAGGSWLGMNDFGLVAAILNRRASLGPAAGKRSRGELVLEALDHPDAVDAVDALKDLSTTAYRSFNMLVADNRDAFWLKSLGHGKVQAVEIPDGLSMLTANDMDDPADQRIAHFLPRFAEAGVPDPEKVDWRKWQELLAEGVPPGTDDPQAALCIRRADGFGTSSSALIAVPAIGREVRPVWLFASGPPDQAEFLPVSE
jgi:uncharacterized protein with NRDE domain